MKYLGDRVVRATTSYKVPGSNSGWPVEFICSPCDCVGFFQVLWCLPTGQRHAVKLIGHSELPVCTFTWMVVYKLYISMSALR